MVEEKCSPLTRVTRINEISSVLGDSTKLLEEITTSLGWGLDRLTSENHIKLAECPIDKNHVMESCNLDKHVGKCHLKSLGVDVQNDSCQSSCFFYKSSSSVISILSDPNESNPVLPSKVLRSRQSGEERLRSYDHIVKIAKSKRNISEQQSEKAVNMTENAPQGDGQQLKSKLEMLAEQRDYKRRRQSYRAKNVHLTKRTPTDIMREIIENRMQELQNLQEENGKTTQLASSEQS